VANSLRYQGEKSLIGVATDLCSAQLISEGSYQESCTKTKANIKKIKKRHNGNFSIQSNQFDISSSNMPSPIQDAVYFLAYSNTKNSSIL
jgi:hypothetical protein